MPLTSEFYWTLAIFIVAAAIVVIMAWLERRPRSGFEPLLLPTTPILLVSGIVAIMSVVHLLNVAGLHTGR
jgi:hypothetical protein